MCVHGFELDCNEEVDGGKGQGGHVGELVKLKVRRTGWDYNLSVPPFASLIRFPSNSLSLYFDLFFLSALLQISLVYSCSERENIYPTGRPHLHIYTQQQQQRVYIYRTRIILCFVDFSSRLRSQRQWSPVGSPNSLFFYPVDRQITIPCCAPPCRDV